MSRKKPTPLAVVPASVVVEPEASPEVVTDPPAVDIVAEEPPVVDEAVAAAPDPEPLPRSVGASMRTMEESLLGTAPASAPATGSVVALETKTVFLYGAAQVIRKGTVMDPNHYSRDEFACILESISTEPA